MFKSIKYIYSSFPVVFFLLLIPFMLEDVPYHADLLGTIDARGNKLMMLLGLLIISGLLVYLYTGIKEKKVLFPLVSILLIFLSVLSLLASIIRMDNLFTGFYRYFINSFGNQISFIVFAVMMIFFISLDIIPQNSIFGIRNSVTLQSQEAWDNIHSKVKPYVLLSSLLSLYVFLLPVISDFIKVVISVLNISFLFVVIISETRNYKKK